jgi:hypothetical protein
MMDRGTVETCRVSFQNKFEKLVHLVGFIIRKLEEGWGDNVLVKQCHTLSKTTKLLLPANHYVTRTNNIRDNNAPPNKHF